MATPQHKHKSVRLLAWEGLQRWSRGGIFAETIVSRAAQQHNLSHADRALLQAIVYDTIRQLSMLDHLRLKLRSGELDEPLRWLVLMGLCQLFVMHQAEHAAVCETVELAPNRVRGVVNGILRNAIRRRAEFEKLLPTLRPAVRYSCPRWLVDRWMQEFGEETACAMLEWNIQQSPLYARVAPANTPSSLPADQEPLPDIPGIPHSITEDALPAEWEPVPDIPGWCRVNGSVPQELLQEGCAYMADPSTRYAVELLAPQPGESVLDACAAPGGKSVAMLQAVHGNLNLLATDAQAHRLPVLRQNLFLATGHSLPVEVFDWTQPCPEEWRGAFDAVLLDVPCSNTGVLQRRVDARWRLSAEEITRLAALQSQILENACAAVRPGGRLVYSTCSIEKEEDADVVQSFLSSHPDFTLEHEHLALPHIVHADGAYAARLQRK